MYLHSHIYIHVYISAYIFTHIYVFKSVFRAEDLKRGLIHLRKEAEKEKKTSKDVHKTNLYALISCVDALNKLHSSIEREKKTRGWPLTTTLNIKVFKGFYGSLFINIFLD